MNKTASETAEFCSSLKRRVDGLAGSVDISVFPPYTSLAAAVTGLADSEIAVGAQNVHWATEGAFTGEVLRPCCASSASTRRSSDTPSGASTSARPTTWCAARGGGARGGVVRDRLRRRDARASGRRGRSRTCSGVRSACSPQDDRLVIAYEPVGRSAPGSPRRPIRCARRTRSIKSLLDVPVLYGGSVTPGNAEELLARRGRRRARRRRFARPRLVRGRFARSRLPPRSARHPRRVGVRAARPWQRDLVGGDAGVRPALGAVPAHHARGLGRCGRPS